MDRKNKSLKEFEIKIYFKNGRVGYFGALASSKERILKPVKVAIKENLTGILEMEDLEDGKLTVINVQEIASIGCEEVAR